jgi:hypothetical protein
MCRHRPTILMVLALVIAAGACRRPPRPAAPSLWRGIALGLFGEDPDWSYDGLLGEIQRLGATHVEVVIPYYQRDVTSTEIGPHTRFSPPDRTVVRTLREARARGLNVLLFPIVRLEDGGPRGDWRGTLRPRDRDAWFASYGRWLVRLADLAEHEGVFALSVGSELSTLDTDRPRWAQLIAAVRDRYHGVLTYSGNWDHFERVSFWDLVDTIGVCGYFELTSPHGATDVASLTQRWRERRVSLESFCERIGRPLVFTELGYLSQRGTHAWPWKEGADEPIDLDEQRRCYAAFIEAWTGSTGLRGVFFWNWYGWGGPHSKGYTPRGKPAAELIGRWFQQLSGTNSSRARPVAR